MDNALPAPTEESHSALATIRPFCPVKHHRAVAAAWFGVVGFSCGFALGSIVAHFVGSHMAFSVPWFAVMCGAVAVLPGFVLGSHILDETKTRSVLQAANCGATVVILSHVLFFVLSFLFSATLSLLQNFIYGVIASLLIGGIVTFPVGCTSAIILYTLSRIKRQPKGCALHGYGEGRRAITGE